jgi:hypothetical protein
MPSGFKKTFKVPSFSSGRNRSCSIKPYIFRKKDQDEIKDADYKRAVWALLLSILR